MQQEADRARCFTRRALFVGGAQVAFFGALAARLYHLQVERSADFALLAEDNRANQRLLVPPRGRIVDRLGRPLARNVPTYRMLVIREQARELRPLLERLAALVTLEPDRIAAVLEESRVRRAFVPLLVREDLSWDEVARVAIHSPELQGAVLDSGLLRDYPEGSVLAHVLGYVGAVNPAEQAADQDPLLQLPEFRIGKSGIERRYDAVLRGRAGQSRVEVNATGREIRELDRREGTPGADVRLALDLDLQRFCVTRLSSESSASAVVVDVRSGGVLALASVPSFEPAAFTGGLRPSVWNELRDDPRTPLVNKCIRGQYPPGSTFKMMTALAALEAGIQPTYQAFCPGHLSLGSAVFHCWKEHGHGTIAMVQALGQSCDVYFYDLARRVGVDAIAAMATRFGLGGKLGIDLPGEQAGLIPTTAWKKATLGQSWQKGETLVCGIGQGYVSVTPLQLAVMAARLANGERAVQPWLVAPGEPGDPPPMLGVPHAHLDVVRAGMREVIHGGRGTARAADLGLPGVEMAGKTGTAQVRRISRADRAVGRHKRKDLPWAERDHALFVCFAPFAEPRYAVAVVVEHGMSGSKFASPIARDIMRRTLELGPDLGMDARGGAV
ncbi:MAG: penicillin-binding protein 2 [Geminicoccaceae bacterium]